MDNQPHHIDDISIIVHLLLKEAAAIPISHHFLILVLFSVVFLYNFLELHILEDLFRGFRGDKVRLTFHPDSEIYHYVASKCRILHGRYLATLWLSSPHLQTTFLNFFGNPPVFCYRRQIFNFLDGGTIALDWLLPSDVIGCSLHSNRAISKDDTTPIVVVVPGLTSDSASPYIEHLVYKLAKQGWNVVVSNHRGLGGMSIMSDCFYNAGWTEDVRVVIKHLHREYPKAVLFAVGLSVGANILVKYLGEDGDNTPIAGAASVCSPWDLLVGDRFINRKLVQRFYDRALAIGLKRYAELHQRVLARTANWEGIKKSCSIRDFDNHATCLVAKYETVDTFYRRCSSVGYVANVSVPLLCISSLDDPLCTKEAIPWDECRANKKVVLATTIHGGHLAFFRGLTAKKLWWVDAVEEFMSVLHSSPFMHVQRNVATGGVCTSMESPIDKVPFVNLREDGMLTVAGHGGMCVDRPEFFSDNKVIDDQNSKNGVGIGSQMQNEPQENQEAAHQHPELPGKITPKENIVVTSEIVAPVRKSMNQLQRQNTISMWLLVYIAIVTTWPLVGSALLVTFKRKLKNAIPAGWLQK